MYMNYKHIYTIVHPCIHEKGISSLTLQSNASPHVIKFKQEIRVLLQEAGDFMGLETPAQQMHIATSHGICFLWHGQFLVHICLQLQNRFHCNG